MKDPTTVPTVRARPLAPHNSAVETWNMDRDVGCVRTPRATLEVEQTPHRYCLLVYTGMQTRFFDEVADMIGTELLVQKRQQPYGIFTYDETAGRYFPGINAPQP